MYRRALAIDEASYGPHHPVVANCLNNLAGVLGATNRPHEAEEMYRRALAIDEASYGADHPLVAIRLNNLAGVLYTTNRQPEAEAMFRRALAILLLFKVTTKHDHPNLQAMLNNWAGALQELGNGEAEVQAAFDSIMAEVTAKAANG
jgi:tetratricopeptide (TPR) repeat protein